MNIKNGIKTQHGRIPGTTKKAKGEVKFFDVMIEQKGRVVWPWKLKKVSYDFGTFAVCPFCGDAMAAKTDGSWWCFTGCGNKVLERDALSQQARDKLRMAKVRMKVTLPLGWKPGKKGGAG